MTFCQFNIFVCFSRFLPPTCVRRASENDGRKRVAEATLFGYTKWNFEQKLSISTRRRTYVRQVGESGDLYQMEFRAEIVDLDPQAYLPA